MTGRTLILVLLLTALAGLTFSQELSGSIRGYKIHNAKVHVTMAAESAPSGFSASIRLDPPKIIDVGLLGVTFETMAEVTGIEQSGDIDFLTFKDLVVNGIAVDAEEYAHPFKIRKGEVVKLPVPLRGFVNTANIAKAGYSEYTARKPEWRVTGTVFVFGRFKKMGFSFKRVIPVPIDLTIKDPLPALARP